MLQAQAHARFRFRHFSTCMMYSIDSFSNNARIYLQTEKEHKKKIDEK